MKALLALLLAARLAHGYTITGGESDTTSSLWWFIPAASCVLGTPAANWDMSGADVPTATCAIGTNVKKGVLAFNDGSGTSIVQPTIEQTILLPQAPTPATAAYVTNGPITVTLMYNIGAITGAVRWCAQVICRGDGETDDGSAYDTVACTDDTSKGTAGQLNLATLTLSGTATDTCAANELLHLKLYRDSDHANDSAAGDAYFLGVAVAWQRFQ